jgi:hypothetical protein
VTAALCKLLGRICHIYLDDITIWSNTVAEHAKHVRLVLNALWKAKLYCNPNKCKFFLLDNMCAMPIWSETTKINTTKTKRSKRCEGPGQPILLGPPMCECDKKYNEYNEI